MTEQEFVVVATKIVQQIIDSIAEKEYVNLASYAQIDSSWVQSGQTPEEAFVSFGEWLDEQLAMWEEYEEKRFVIDHFDESCLEDISFRDNRAFVVYNPTNSGERLDLWFEIDFDITSDGKLNVKFNVNI